VPPFESAPQRAERHTVIADSAGRNPLVSNSTTSRLIYSLLRRFRSGISSFVAIPTVHQKKTAVE